MTLSRVAWAFAFWLVWLVSPGQAQKGTTVQLPTFGVAIDAAGLLSIRRFPDPDGRLHARRMQAARAQLPNDVQRPSRMRKVSLVKLERAVRRLREQGRQPDQIMRSLAGLQRLQYVFVFPDEKDVVIAGPAEGFCADGSGRMVGLKSGLPVLQLEDLVVALRAYPPQGQPARFIGCTISPTPEGLRRLTEFQRQIPRVVSQRERGRIARQIAEGSRRSLGMASIRVFGVSPRTQFAQVLVEADYRMKLIGIGLEPPPVKMLTFLDALRRPQHGILQRWWFTPHYDCLTISEDRLAMELRGQGVQLQTEDKVVTPIGGLLNLDRPPSKAGSLYAQGFTRKYPEIAARAVVFAHLRTLVDMSVAAAFLRRTDGYVRSSWSLTTFGDESVYAVASAAPPQRVAATVNVIWKGNRLISPAGGVSIEPDRALHPEQLTVDRAGRLTAERARVQLADNWWWD